jgi:ketosteroid isomerase-like protein
VDNLEVILSLYERVARGEQPGDLFHDDVEWSMPHPGGDARGIAEVGAFWRDYEAVWESREIDLEDIRELDDGRVLVLLPERARGRASGIETEASPGVIWTLRDGRIAGFKAWLDQAEALRAAGLDG